MDALPIGGKSDALDSAETAGAEARMLRARLDMLVSSLSGSPWFNPCLTLIWMLPFLGLFPILGTVKWPEFAIIIATQFAIGVGGRVIRQGYARDPSNPARWLGRLAIYQVSAGVGWGIFAWLIWTNGNLLNNILVTMTVCGVIWGYAFSRCMHVGIYLAGVLPTALLTIARLVYPGTDIAVPMSLVVVTNVALVYIFTFTLRRQVEVMLRMRFANDDLAVELRETRDDALRKRFEAEAANASKTTFLANMSHELRTPLNAILGFSELISSETLGPVGTIRYRDYAKDINSSGTHLLSLINDILDIDKIEIRQDGNCADDDRAETGARQRHERDPGARAGKAAYRDGRDPARSGRPLFRRARLPADRHQPAFQRREIHAGGRPDRNLPAAHGQWRIGALGHRQRSGHSGDAPRPDLYAV